MASGQLVNYNKSELVFSKKVQHSMKQDIQQILPMTIVSHYPKYLGQPTQIGRSKAQVFNFIQDKLWKKLKGWKEKNLSFAGRGTLIKAVAQAIPTYLMSNFLIPKGLCDKLESMMCNFWWGSNVDKRKIHWVNWKKTCKQKTLGGMGFRNLRAFNEALLAKQGWRILTEPGSLMAKTLKAKYFPKHQFLQAKKGNRPSYSWQSIQQASWILKKGCYWLVGNGKNINIWEDRWISPKDGNTTWSTKPTTSNLEHVSDLIDHTSQQWNSQLISQNFIPIEADNILKLPLTNTSEDDLICWQGTKDGHYTVRSGYNAQMEWAITTSAQAQPSNLLQGAHIWNKLWKIEAPPKQLHLLWRILHNAIPTKINLLNRGIMCDSMCPMCYREPETTNHIFQQCEWARQVWFGCPLTITTSNVQTQSFPDWLSYMLINSTKECMQTISTVIYSIWIARNKRIFQNKSIPAKDVVAQAMKNLSEYRRHWIENRLSKSTHATSGTRNNKSWNPPSRNCHKLNVDAHLKDDGRWGFGLILRRDDGRCVGAATRVREGPNDAAMAEATGLHEAILFAQANQLKDTSIELDSAIIVNAIARKNFPRTNWGKSIRNSSRVLRKLNNVSVSWVSRDGNRAAHALARWALREPNRNWVSNYPSCILTHIQKDMSFVSLLSLS
ncbi:putative mitochondrial protein [Trifolium repens]|nr:putative mitochondrial protein [Trifolium repens]